MKLSPPLVLAALAACHPGPRSEPAALLPAAGHLQWLGGPTALLDHGGFQVITDPMLGPRGPGAFVLPHHPSTGAANAAIARYTAGATAALDQLDAILVSHTHADHVDARAVQVLPKGLPLVVAAAGAAAMRAAGFTDVRPLDWGDSVTLRKPGVELRVTAVPAHHAHDPALEAELGRGNGYVLEWNDARGSYRVYWTGDSVVTDDMTAIASRFGALDLFLPHLGGVGGDGERGLRTMTAEEAVSAIAALQPRLVIPIHHTTFSHYREPIAAFEQRTAEAGQAPRVRVLAEGHTAALP